MLCQRRLPRAEVQMIDPTQPDQTDLRSLPRLEKKIDQEKLEKDRAEVANIILEALQSNTPSVAYDEKGDLRPQYPDSQTGWGLLMKALGIPDVLFLEGVLDQISDLCQAV